MFRVTRGFRLSVFGLVAAVGVLAIAPDTADARRYRRQHVASQKTSHRVSHHSVRDSGYSPPFASIVVDANTGRAIEEKNPDSLRHPASLTKIMTLYLLFERLDAGKIKLTTQMPVSEHAADQSPTKLGLKPGSSLEVEDAIRGLVTRSANDAAVVIAEALGGDEESFARMMTARAHALGMSKTTYMNASGLPDDDQVTTARDQALLGRAIQERFPKYYRYFSTSSFTWRGEEIRNHNHLLGRVEGVDGIKTGYTHDSGFNLVTSVRRGDRHIVAVVLGGSSAGSRDAKMRDLIEEHIAEASTKHTATMIAEAETAPAPTPPPSRSLARRATAPAPAATAAGGYALSSTSSVSVPSPAAGSALQGPGLIKNHTAAGSTDPIKPIAVKTVRVKMAPIHTATLAPAAPMIAVTEETGATAPAPAAAPAPVAPAPVAVAPAPTPVAEPKAAPAHPDVRAAVAQAMPAPPAEPAKPVVAAYAPAPELAAPKAEPAAPARNAPVRTGWMVQVGAFASESEAKQHLEEAQSKAKKLLGRADPFTEAVTKGDKTFYRARFAGLERDQAEATCRQLRRSDIACMAIKN